MLESRRSERHMTLRTGRISVVDEPTQIDCAILNISLSGACILVPASAAISEFFELVIDCEDAIRNCRRIWREGAKVGVAFVNGEDQVSSLTA